MLDKFQAGFLFFVLLLIPINLYAIERNTLELKNEPVIDLNQGKYLIYKDASANINIDEIRKLQSQGRFTRIQRGLSAGYVPDAYWLYFSLNKTDLEPSIWWLEVLPPFLDDIQLYHFNSTDSLDFRKGGDFTLHSNKEEDYRGTIFKFDLEAGKHEFYIRLKTSSTMAAFIKLWQPEAFNKSLRSEYFLFGLYFSLILTVFIFNAFNYATTRKAIYLAFSGYLFLNLIHWLGNNGFIFEFIFPQHPLLANLALGVSLSLSVSLAFVFFCLLFELKKYHPYIYYLTPIGIVLGIVTAISTPLGYYQLFIPWLLLVGIISLLTSPWVMLRLWRSGEIWNRLIVVGYSGYIILVGINILGSLSLLRYDELNIMIGMASNIFQILVHHFAILMHYRKIEKEHAHALTAAEKAKQQIEYEQAFNKEQSQLLSMITHEIRTPIAIIDAANESLQLIDEKGQNSQDDKDRRYQRIHKAVKRMNMVMDMAIAQKDNEALPLIPEELDLIALTHEVIGLSGVGAETRIKLEVTESHISVVADKRLMRIALLNLIDNALKYSPGKSIINITITASGDNNLRWIIRDQGIGISAGMEQKIFEKFIRGDERSNQPGMGLGLYLVSNIIQRHQGKIEISNRQGGGSVFTIHLPKHA